MTKDVDQYQDRVIVFIDILGFREHINRTVGDPAYFNKMKLIFNKISNYQKDNVEGPHALKESGKEVTVFSDSIVISYPANTPGSVFLLLNEVIHIQLDLLMNGVLFRGGVTAGELYHNDNIVYGPAMVEAYELESRVAVYPRVIVSEKALDAAVRYPVHPEGGELEYIKEYLINTDFDGVHYIDFMSQLNEYNSTHDYINMLSNLKKVIEDAIIENELKPYVSVKFQWLKNYYNLTLGELDTQYTDGLYIE